MLRETARSLERKPRVFRFFYYMFSGFRLVTFRQWSDKGEPNPFVAPNYERRTTSRQEIVDVFALRR